MKRLLLDNCVDIRFGALLSGLQVQHARDVGWGSLANGELLEAADLAGFDVMITVDKQMRFQQSLKEKRISVVVLNSRFVSLEDIAPLAPLVLAAIESVPPASFQIIGSVAPEDS